MRLEGRRLWFVGIGGAGLSGYALLAQAWGAEVAGWDRYETPYLEHVRGAGIPVTISDAPEGAPAGWEAVVSTAFAGQVPGRSRAELLAELVTLQDSIVVAGAHGKTTTAAMIAFVLDQLGTDPAFLIGGDVPQLGGNARAGSGWLVVEGDESDRTISHLRPKIAVVTNVDLDHHAEFGSRAEVAELFDTWLAEVPQVVRGEELEPHEIRRGRDRRAQSPECGSSGGSARAGGRLAHGRARQARGVQGRRPQARGSRRSQRRGRGRRLRAPSGGDRSDARRGSRAAADSSSSSRISSRGPATARLSSATRSQRPTSSLSPTCTPRARSRSKA